MPAGDLAGLIAERIRTSGPMTFAEYARCCLYEPGLGFFVRCDEERGPGRDFVTSPEISPHFAWAITRIAGRVWGELGRPAELTVVEAGGGSGRLARDLFAWAAEWDAPWLGCLSYTVVDPRPDSALAAADVLDDQIERVASLEELGPQQGELTGLAFANELLDNIPGHLLSAAASGWRELYVVVADAGFALAPGPLSDPSLLPERPPATESEIVAVAPGQAHAAAQLASLLKAGRLLLVDFGRPPPGAPLGGVRTFSGHRSGVDPLVGPGSRDIVFPVDWDAVRTSVEEAGLGVIPLQPQREFLEALGIGEELARIKAEEEQLLGAGQVLEAMQKRDRRIRATALLDPDGLGGFDVFSAWR